MIDAIECLRNVLKGDQESGNVKRINQMAQTPATGDDVTTLIAVIDRRQLGGRGQRGVMRGQGGLQECLTQRRGHHQNKDRNVPGES